MGLVHIYHGDGKGKTTSAIGLSIRALGAGFKVIFLQFLKGGKTAELETFAKLDGIEVIRCEKDYKFTWLLSDEEKIELKCDHNELLDKAIALCTNDGTKTLLVLDELCATHRLNLIDTEKVEKFIADRHENLEIVITGREPKDELIALANYISEVKKIKHPMDEGVGARKGIEQ